jgi:rubredoxin
MSRETEGAPSAGTPPETPTARFRTNDPSWICPWCSEVTASRDALVSHMASRVPCFPLFEDEDGEEWKDGAMWMYWSIIDKGVSHFARMTGYERDAALDEAYRRGVGARDFLLPSVEFPTAKREGQ